MDNDEVPALSIETQSLIVSMRDNGAIDIEILGPEGGSTALWASQARELRDWLIENVKD
jgi:hypothetical protein